MTSRLVKAFEDLKQGKVLDVSNIDQEGKGYRTIDRPNPKMSRTKVEASPDFPVVSDNVDAFVRALNLLGYTKYKRYEASFIKYHKEKFPAGAPVKEKKEKKEKKEPKKRSKEPPAERKSSKEMKSSKERKSSKEMKETKMVRQVSRGKEEEGEGEGMSYAQFEQAMDEFRRSPYARDIRKWERDEMTGKDVMDKYKDDTGKIKPKGLTLFIPGRVELSPNEPLFIDFIRHGHAENNVNVKPYESYRNKYIIAFITDKSGAQDPGVAAMSYFHLLVIPADKKYNVVSLERENIPLLEYMMGAAKDIFHLYYVRKLTECLARTIFKLRALEKDGKAPIKDDIFDTFELVDRRNKYLTERNLETILPLKDDLSLVKVSDLHEKIWSLYLTDQLELDDQIEDLEHPLEFYLHVAPNHSVGQLHMHAVFGALKTKTFEHFAGKKEIVSLDKVIEYLETH